MILSHTTSGMQYDESTPVTSDINTVSKESVVPLSFIDQTQFAYNSIKLYFFGWVLKPFESFTMNSYNIDLDSLIINIQEGKYNVYDILSEFTSYLQDHNYNKPLSSTTLRNRIKAVKNFLEFNDVDISNNKFKLKIRLPKSNKEKQEALTKDDIRDIILACSDIRLKTYVMFLASTGMRAVEALSSQNAWSL